MSRSHGLEEPLQDSHTRFAVKFRVRTLLLLKPRLGEILPAYQSRACSKPLQPATQRQVSRPSCARCCPLSVLAWGLLQCLSGLSRERQRPPVLGGEAAGNAGLVEARAERPQKTGPEILFDRVKH